MSIECVNCGDLILSDEDTHSDYLCADCADENGNMGDPWKPRCCGSAMRLRKATYKCFTCRTTEEAI